MSETLSILLTPGFYRIFFFILSAVLIFDLPEICAQNGPGLIISGTVRDATTGETIPGVNIVVGGTFKGAVTNGSGKYEIQVPDKNATLVFSFVGYAGYSTVVGDERIINVSLKQSSTELDEVVFVGYGVQRKESVVGAISQTSGDMILQVKQGGDLGNALTGALPGLITLQTSGIPGGVGEDDDYTHMFIRGKKTWNNSSPLVLVDGVERPLHDINPYEVESISVLKDASATAVFGVKGANGVILITTLRGKEGKARLGFDYTTTIKTISRVPERAGSYQANLMKNYAILNEIPITEASWKYIVPNQWLEYYKNKTYPEYLPDVNWQKEFSKDYAWDQNANLTLTGGTKNVKYFGALSYLHEGDIINIQDMGQGYSPNFLFDRVNFRSNMDFDITKTTRLTANLSGYHSISQRPSGNKWAAWYSMYSTPPDIYPVKYSDGTYGQNEAWERFENGILAFNYSGYRIEKTTNINTDFIIDQKLDFITEGLSASARLSYDNTGTSSGPNITGHSLQSKWIAPDIVDEITPDMTEEEIRALEEKYTTWNYPRVTGEDNFDWYPLPNEYSAESASSYAYRSLYYQVSLNYARDFNRHSVTALALMSRQERTVGDNFTSFREDWVGRITYNFDRRYLLEFNGAYNGSEKFSREYRFGFFPSAAVGWVISNERFFEKIRPVMNNFKIRYSDGIVGSDEGIERWLYVGSWIAYPYTDDPGNYGSTEIYRFGAPYLHNAYPLRYEGVIANPDIQ
jgi:TonB-linked SusC/RagA family outer membrane protein